jgi:non-heme chloroperoxidase
MSQQPRTVSLPTGVNLEFVEHGDPNGVPVLLLHGGIDSWHSFARVLPHLPSSIRALVPTLRGQGRSSKPSTDYRPSDMAEDVIAFMDAVGVDAAVVVGHSSTSLVAERVAIDHPGRTLGLVLIGGFVTMRDKPITHQVRDAVLDLEDPVDEGFVREFQQGTIVQDVPEAFLERVTRESNTPAPVWQGLNAGVLEQDWAGELHRIQAPTLLIWGSEDIAVPRDEQDRLATAIPNARLVVYEGAGHSLHWEEPERLAGDLAAFVERLPVAATSGRAG